MSVDIILQYFPELTPSQITLFEKLGDLYRDWNQKINVISRKDIDNLYLHHVLHSLSIANYIKFKPGSKILDLGTGGGFPGIPLAILFEESHFHLIDARKKKILVVNEVSKALGLSNVSAQHVRAEELKIKKFDFVLTRAVASIDKLWDWSASLLSQKHINSLPNGLIALKGGNIKQELKLLPKKAYHELTEINDYLEEEYFNEKYIVYVQ